MHYLCLVVGDDPDGQLQPFAEYSERPPYRKYLDEKELRLMAEHYALSVGDLQSLVGHLRDWTQAEGGIDGGRLYSWSTANLDARFDWYKVGGRFDGYLRLTRAIEPSGWRRLLGARPRSRANQARRADVEETRVLADVPAALLLTGQWHECPITDDASELALWNERFAQLWVTIPPDALLTVVDAHS